MKCFKSIVDIHLVIQLVTQSFDTVLNIIKVIIENIANNLVDLKEPLKNDIFV